MKARARLWTLLSCAVLGGCRGASAGEASPREPIVTSASPLPPDAEQDESFESCQARVAELKKKPSLPGTPELDRRRAEVLGRARGEPVIFVQEPRAPATESKLTLSSVRALKKRLAKDKPELRRSLLREGYLFASDPLEALALVAGLELVDLFDEPVIWLQRGSELHELRRVDEKPKRYVHAAGSELEGRKAELLLFDRVAITNEELAKPLHRDLRSLAHQTGFDRARIAHSSPEALVAELRFGGVWVESVLASDGARLRLECMALPAAARKRVNDWRDQDEPRRRALGRLRAAIDDQVAEGLPFDRPREEETAERDGQLRPAWSWAYKAGQSWFSFDERTYPVFDPMGRPHPPQVCVDFVLDSFERASGSWFSPRDQQPERKLGALDFDAYEIDNRRAVLAFEKFASERKELFEHVRFEPAERIQFRERERFFGFLQQNADRFRPGDVVAIQGLKNDGLIHQHAILIEDVDPVTGFPDALADQMRRPRRRTWEGIMAEAPLRSLLYRVRPRPEILLKLDRDG